MPTGILPLAQSKVSKSLRIFLESFLFQLDRNKYISPILCVGTDGCR